MTSLSLKMMITIVVMKVEEAMNPQRDLDLEVLFLLRLIQGL